MTRTRPPRRRRRPRRPGWRDPRLWVGVAHRGGLRAGRRARCSAAADDTVAGLGGRRRPWAPGHTADRRRPDRATGCGSPTRPTLDALLRRRRRSCPSGLQPAPRRRRGRAAAARRGRARRDERPLAGAGRGRRRARCRGSVGRGRRRRRLPPAVHPQRLCRLAGLQRRPVLAGVTVARRARRSTQAFGADGRAPARAGGADEPDAHRFFRLLGHDATSPSLTVVRRG